MKKTLLLSICVVACISGSLLSQKEEFPRQGEVYLVHLDPTVGTEIQKTRPCVIISNDENNAHSTRVIVVPLTSKAEKYFKFAVPTLVAEKKGQALIDQIRTIDRGRLEKLIGTCDHETMIKISQLLTQVLSLSTTAH